TARTAPPSPDPAVYLEFFRWTQHQVDTPVQGYLNGLPPAVTTPAISDRLRIPHEDARKLLDLAPLWVNEVNRLEEDSRPVVFQSRLELTNTGRVSDATAALLSEIEVRRTAIILKDVQQMRNALGDDAFRRVEDYIRAHESALFKK
ncbi:MAG TPA: hypothetical protein VHC72_04545, partial [Bryobacteraceae bacterium]|nr:hypothetical protein [Bryobacteraceae bacterium]